MVDRQEVTVQTYAGPVVVEAVVIGPLAAHEDADGRDWRVTHLWSGLVAARDFDCESDAIAAARDLVDVCDWSVLAGMVARRNDYRPALQEIMTRVHEVATRHGGVIASSVDRVRDRLLRELVGAH